MLLFFATLGLPIVLGTLSFLFYRDKITNGELAGLFGISILSFSIMFFTMRHYNVDDTRYHSEAMHSIRYYEPWNEYIHRTCTRTICSGAGKTRSCRTYSYDCSYVKHHSEKWVKRNKKEYERDITQNEYNKILTLWGGKTEFVDMNRNYHTLDGDGYHTQWNGDIRTTETVNTSQSYENRTLTANTLFKHEPFKEEEVKKRSLFDYNNSNSTIYNPFFTISDSTLRKYRYLNTLSQDYRVYVLYFKNKDRKVAFDQKRHWQGGNDNELVICVGLDNENKTVWVEPFSWCKTPLVESRINGFFANSQGEFDLEALYPLITSSLQSEWKKRDFHDFDYIDIELSIKQIIWIWIILSCINIGATLYIIKNEYKR